MQWKLPLLLCVFLIGFSNCEDANVTVADGAADDSVTTQGGAGDSAAPVDLTTAKTQGESTAGDDSAAADAVVTTAVPPAAEATTASAGQDPTTAGVVAEVHTLPDPDQEGDAPVTHKPAEPSTSSQEETTQPRVGEETTQSETTQPAADGSTAAATLPNVVGEDPGDVPSATPKPDEVTTKAEEAITTVGDEVTTQLATTEPVITTTAAPETTTTPWSGEPCDTPYVLSETDRHFTATVGNEPVNDRKLKKTWYRFEQEGSPAIITSQPIKPKQCGTEVPFHLNLKDKKLPEKDSNGTYEICSSVSSEHGLLRCAEPQPIEVKNCGDHKYVYNISPVKWAALLKTKAGICVQKPGEIVPLHYLAISQEESDRLDVPVTSVDDVSKEQFDGIVTVEFKYPAEPAEDKTDTDYLEELDVKYRPMIARALNGLPRPTEAPKEEPTTVAAAPEEKQKEEKEDVVAGQPPPKEEGAAAPEKTGRPAGNMDTDADIKGPRAAPLVANPRFRRDSRVKRDSDEYTKDDVHYVGPTPRMKRGVLQKAVYVDDPETTAVDGDKLLTAVQGLNKTGELGDEMNLTVLAIYKGLPRDIAPLVVPVAAQSTWKQHEGVFITIIVLLLLLLLILLIGCCCIKCRNRRGSWTANKRPNKGRKGSPTKKPLTAHESPLPDDEIKKDEANMTERENPAYTANGSGGHIAKPNKDDEQGWIVPIEELNRAERNRPDVQDTRL